MVSLVNSAAIQDWAAPAGVAMLLVVLAAWRRWTPVSLYLACNFAILAAINLDTILAALASTGSPSATMDVQTATVRMALGLLAMTMALIRPRGWGLLPILLASLFLLVLSTIPIYRFAVGLGEGSPFVVNRATLDPVIGLPVLLLFSIIPGALGVIWGFEAHSRTRSSLADLALTQHSRIFGAVSVLFAVLTTSVTGWPYATGGALAGQQIQAAAGMSATPGLANMIFALLLGGQLYLLWLLPRLFITPAIDLIEAGSKPGDAALEPAAHPLWRSLAHELDARRGEARARENELRQVQAQMSSLFDNIPAAINVIDRSGQLVMANRSALENAGVSADDAINRQVTGFAANWRDPDAFAQAGQQVFETGQARRIMAKRIARDGGEDQICDVILFPIGGDAGKPDQLGLIMVDITDQQRSQQELAASRGTLQAFFENIPAMTFIIGPDRKYVTANSYAIDSYGFEFLSPENLIGQSDLTGTPEHWHPVIAAAHRRVMEEGKPHEVETSIDLPGGALSLYVSRFPIRNAEGAVTHVGGLIFDRTAERRASDQVAATREALHQSEKLAALGQLLAGVAHELNNPLTVVVGRSAILEEKLRETAHAKAIADLREAADRCNRIVRTFLAMARQSAPRRAAVQVNDAIEAALDMTAYGLRSSGIELVSKLDPRLPEVEADEDQLVQVFTNLLINARHALEEHAQGAGQVTITTRAKGGKLLVEIADNGPGVPADIVSRIFEPFFTTKAVGEGTGMGLAMSRGMIEEHGGKLAYSDARGGGAMFTVELPIAAPAHSAAPEGETEQAQRKGRGRVLVIDDEPGIRGLLVEILEGIELDCSECGDGAAALELLGRQDFDLVFCDVRMPVMDGIRFRQHLADTHPALLERLVFISGDVLQRGNARQAEIAGHAFVEKPFNPAEVRALALSLLDGPGDTP